MRYNLYQELVSDDPNEPGSILIIKSGWDDMYHVICEDSREGISPKFGSMTSAEIFECFDVDVTDSPTLQNIITSNPNNMELGAAIRTIANKK